MWKSPKKGVLFYIVPKMCAHKTLSNRNRLKSNAHLFLLKKKSNRTRASSWIHPLLLYCEIEDDFDISHSRVKWNIYNAV